MSIRSDIRPFKHALQEFVENRAPQSAAAMSFFAVTTVPPLLVVIAAVLGLVYSAPRAIAELVGQVEALFGASTGETIAAILARRASAPNATAAVTGVVVLLIGASGFYSQLQSALNQVWGVDTRRNVALRMVVLKRLVGMGAVVGTGFLLLVSLVISALMARASVWFETLTGWNTSLAAFTEAFIAVATLTGMFAFIYKVLPDVELRWSDVWKGAVTTSLLFILGKFAMAWYLGRTDYAADYGSAGALVLILFWVYYTSLILLFGAELTRAQAHAAGRRIVPDRHAERVCQVRESEREISLQKLESSPASAKS